jgi:hypothetical protein
MLRIALPVCLLVALAAGVALAAPKNAPKAAASTGKALTQDEKLALACLGQIGAAAKTKQPSKAVQAKADRARRLFASLPAKAQLRPLIKALHCEPAGLRIFAAESLARLDEKDTVRPLLWRVVREKDKDVRAALVKTVRALKDPGSVHVLGRALASRYAPFRERAIEALVGLGDELAYPYLISKWEGRSGDFPRVYFTQSRQLSYIQDFDVEVASTSFIADPIVGVLQDATVQGVKILATEQIEYLGAFRAYRKGLESLSGERMGSKVKAWRSWWELNKERLLKARAARYAETTR